MATYYLELDEGEEAFDIEELDDGTFRIEDAEGTEWHVDAREPQEGLLHLLMGQRSISATYRFEDGETVVGVGDETHSLMVLNERQKRMAEASDSSLGADQPELESPIAGKVVALPCEEGAAVEKGDVVAVVEAMKMENDLKAHRSGRISSIHVTAEEEVDIGDRLVSIDS